jgi:hypothetical protein
MSKARNMARMGQDTSAGYTGAFDMPAGTTAERPASAGLGWTRLNTDTGSVEVYDGTNWNAVTRPFISSVTGTIYAGDTSNLVIAGQNFTSTITVRFIEGGSTVADVTGVAVSSGSATVAVPAAVYGQTAGDSIEIKVINSDGTMSANGVTKTVQALPTGGTITTSGGYRYHTFTSSSSLVVPSGFSVSADYLIVAGGGSGGNSGAENPYSGGGGAGGYIGSSTTLSAQTYTITVGAGASSDANGSNSSAFSQTAIGGGRGGSYPSPGAGASGGSGGGAGSAGGTFSGGSATSGQGNAGGSTNNAAGYQSAGGGGAGAAGGSVSGNGGAGGAGGVGLNWQSLGTFYAGGGGGAGYNGAGGAGGNGGGGTGGSYNPNVSCTGGSANRGGGGGGKSGGGGTVTGGSGIVIVRYQIPT